MISSTHTYGGVHFSWSCFEKPWSIMCLLNHFSWIDNTYSQLTVKEVSNEVEVLEENCKEGVTYCKFPARYSVVISNLKDLVSEREEIKMTCVVVT